jgi:peptidoglycan/xylan/chitin deacetylase (PgdA/CDA1 family)
MTETDQAYSADRSFRGKLRRRLVRLGARRPARLRLARPMVSFTFDDAPQTAARGGAAILESQGARGTYYVSVGLAGQDGPVGRCASEADMTAVAARGHEIACHTFSHLDCGQADAGRIAEDVDRNAAALSGWRVGEVTNFAYPYGDVSLAAKRALGRRFNVLRALHPGVIRDGVDLNQAPAVGIEGAGGEAKAMGWLRRAAAAKAWLILYTHDVAEQPSPWGCTPDALRSLIDAARAMDFDIVTVSEGARRLG